MQKEVQQKLSDYQKSIRDALRIQDEEVQSQMVISSYFNCFSMF